MKTAIVIDETLPAGLLANAAACVVSGLFHNEEDLLGPGIEGKDCTFIPITKIPILILKKGHKDFLELLERAKVNNLKYMLFTHEGQSTANYDEYVSRVTGESAAELKIIALGAIGDDKLITKFAGDLPLLRG